MEGRNETISSRCVFLNDGYLSELYAAFSEAFSDYVIPFALTKEQFRNHIDLTAVDLALTAGYFVQNAIVGFSLNGFGEWNGRKTVYDAGTGVVPSARRKGVGLSMFEMMIPYFKRIGVEQYLLEVITSNSAAISLYEKLGFRSVRRLALLQSDGPILRPIANEKVEIREISEPDWHRLVGFWDTKPSWQNSVEAIGRSTRLKRIHGAFLDGECVGYVVFSGRFGRIAQIAVAHENRGKGIGSELVRSVRSTAADGFSMQVINIDTAEQGAVQFFSKLGFNERLSQYEMLLDL